MKKKSSNSRSVNQILLHAAELEDALSALRAAESVVEFEMVIREIERIRERMENWGWRKGA